MKDIKFYIENLKSIDPVIRKKALFDLMYVVCMKDDFTGDELKISDDIKSVYHLLDNEAKAAAFDILSRFRTEIELYELAKIELIAAYENFKTTHAYMLKLLEAIEQVEQGSIDSLGDQYSIDKHFANAHKWLQINNPTALD